MSTLNTRSTSRKKMLFRVSDSERNLFLKPHLTLTLTPKVFENLFFVLINVTLFFFLHQFASCLCECAWQRVSLIYKIFKDDFISTHMMSFSENIFFAKKLLVKNWQGNAKDENWELLQRPLNLLNIVLRELPLLSIRKSLICWCEKKNLRKFVLELQINCTFN